MSDFGTDSRFALEVMEGVRFQFGQQQSYREGRVPPTRLWEDDTPERLAVIGKDIEDCADEVLGLVSKWKPIFGLISCQITMSWLIALMAKGDDRDYAATVEWIRRDLIETAWQFHKKIQEARIVTGDHNLAIVRDESAGKVTRAKDPT